MPLSRPLLLAHVDSSSLWLSHCPVVTAASSGTHFSCFQNGGPPGKHLPVSSFPQRARGRISRKIPRRVRAATSLTFSEPWAGPQQGLHLSPGELWGEALSQPWGGESAVYSFNLYCYFLLASPSLLQSSGVVIFKFKLLCGFCFLIGSLLLSCIIVAFHSAEFFVPTPTPHRQLKLHYHCYKLQVYFQTSFF